MMRPGVISERLLNATDVQKMIAWFEDHVGVISPGATAIEDLRIPRVFPHRDGGFAIQYVVRVSGGDLSMPASATVWGHLLDNTQSIPDYASANRDRCIVSEAIGLVLSVFPFDPKLDVVESLIRTGWELPCPAAYPSESPFESARFSISSAQLLSYRLARRCTLKLRLARAGSSDIPEQWTVVAKVMRPKRAIEIYESSQNLARRGFGQDAADGLTIPHVYGVDTAHGILYMEAVPGVTLHDAAESGDFAEISYHAGRIIRKFHSLDSRDSVTYTASDELAMLNTLIRSVSVVFPGGHADLMQMIAILEAGSHRVTEFIPAAIHRDFFDKQVLYYQDRTTLLDWTPRAVGDPAIDVGNFLAHLRLRALQCPESAPRIAAGRSSFADGYMSIDIVDGSRVQWWKASALTRLACLYALRPRWRSLAPELLREAAMYQGNESRTVGRIV